MQADRTSREARRWRLAFGWSVVFFVALNAALFARFGLEHRSEPRADGNQRAPAAPTSVVAVLPFRLIGPVDGNRSRGSDFAGDLRQALERVGVPVAGRFPDRRLEAEGAGSDTRLVAPPPRVGFVVSGSMRMAGRRATVTVQLAAAAGGERWTEEYEEEVDRLAGVRDRIVEFVRDRMAARAPGPSPHFSHPF